MISFAINLLKKITVRLANGIGDLINSLPTKEEQKKVKKVLGDTSLFSLKENKNELRKANDTSLKMKGDHRKKGRVAAETMIYNHPRKDIPKGRNH